ncbi:MAG: hypothetical protein J6C02_01010, partial [Peptococcaceae bacterium]|nr:hypothetical protein [Peptococcaceae bacterium]
GILVYGLVYYQYGQRQYMVTADPAKLISFLNDVENRSLFPTPIESYSERLIIPEGEEENITNGIKLKLVRKLQEAYPSEVFAVLAQLNAQKSSCFIDAALQQYRLELESVFDRDKIKAFCDLCTKAYLRGNVSELTYRQLVGWCEKRFAQLADHIPPVGSKEKYFYGMAVLENHAVSRCIINANLSCMYEEKCKLEQQGKVVTAWHEKLFAMERQESLRGVQQQMAEFLKTIYDDTMIGLIASLEQMPGAVSAQCFHEALKQVRPYGEKAEALLQYYGKLWGVSSAEEDGTYAETK